MAKPADLKTKLLKALANSTSQQPVDVTKLYRLGAAEEVQAVLLELYNTHKVHCCVITRRGVENIVWWQLIEMEERLTTTQQQFVDKRGGHSRKVSELSQAAHEKVVECPGIAAAALIQYMLQKSPKATKAQALMTLGNMRHQKRVRAEGKRGHYIYHPGKETDHAQAR